MSDYVKVTDFATKDALPSGDPNKKVRGTEIDAELEAIEAAVATKANLSSPALTGTPTAPTAAASTNNTQIATTAHVKSAIGLYFTGMIVMWSGSVASIPSGWALCDGTNGTPNLSNRFVVGAGDSYAVAATGGAVSGTTDSQGGHNHSSVTGGHALTTAQLPSHSHSVPQIGVGATWGADSRWPFMGSAPGYGRGLYVDQPYDTNAAGSNEAHTHSISTDGAHTHTVATLPPYYALCFIMKTA